MKKVSQRHLLLTGAGTAIIGVGFLIGLLALGTISERTILAGVRIGTLPVGGLTQVEAEAKVAAIATKLDTIKLQVSGSTEVYDLVLADYGLAVSPSISAKAAFELGADTNSLRAGWNRFRSWLQPITLLAAVEIDREIYAAATTSLLAEMNTAPENAQLELVDGNWSVVPGTDGQVISSSVFESVVIGHVARLKTDPLTLIRVMTKPTVSSAQAELFLTEADRKTAESIVLKSDDEELILDRSQLAVWVIIRPVPSLGDQGLALTLDGEKVKAYIATLGTRFDTEPINARVVFRDGQVQITQASHDGRVLDQTKAVEEILQVFHGRSSSRVVSLPFTTKVADVASSTLQSLGLKELIGTATTNYAGSPDNRRHNIATGVKYLAGKLIKPGEEFTTVGTLGNVDGTTGYLPELVIKENRTVPEYGGGLCQVSTTLFRSALNAGLKITERRNHSYRVSYYEKGVGPGLDATIYLPAPDLKFLNDTPGWVLVQGSVNAAKSEVTFELYGTSDGRRSEIGKPVILSTTPAPEAIYVETADLPAGTTKQLEKAHDGARTTVSYRVYRGDQVIHEQSFASTYKAWAARYLVGMGSVPTPTDTSPAPDPTPAP